MWRYSYYTSIAIALLSTLSLSHAGPAISTGSSSLTFTGQVYSVFAGQTVTISNSGDAELNYTITSDRFWLSVSNASGSLAAGQATSHVVMVSTLGRDVMMTHDGCMTISDPTATNNPQTIPVNLTLNPVPAPTALTGWGSNNAGAFNIPGDLTHAARVAGGDSFTIALRTDGTITAWGVNSANQINVPSGITNAVALAVGENHSLALKPDGTVIAWGFNNLGQTNVPGGLTNAVSIGAGAWHSLAVKADGTVLAWGMNDLGQATVPASISNVIAAAAGHYHSIVLKANGTIEGWGDNTDGQLNIPPGLSNVVAIGSGHHHCVALKSDGTVVAWGSNAEGQLNIPAGLSNVVSLGYGHFHTIAMKADGTVVSWGYNANGQINTPSTLTNVVGVGGAWYHSLAWTAIRPVISIPSPATLTFTGQVYSSIASQSITVSNSGNTNLNYTISSDMFWLSVSNASGSLAAGQSTNHMVNVNTRGRHALRTYTGHLTISDPSATNNPQSIDINLRLSSASPPSKAIVWNSITWISTNFPFPTYHQYFDLWSNVSDVVAIDANYHYVALRADGTVIASSLTNSPAGLTNATSVAAGYFHAMALRSDGTVTAWGTNSYGILDVPNTLSNVVDIDAEAYHSLALRSNGTVVSWGGPAYSFTNMPPTLSNVVDIASGAYHSLALLANGTVVSWGWNTNGQTNVPSGLTDVVAVTAGYYHSAALRANGTVVAWGGSSNIYVPTNLTNVVNLSADFRRTVALIAGGTVRAWGDDNEFSEGTNVPGGLTNAVSAICNGAGFITALIPAQKVTITSSGGSSNQHWMIRGATQNLSVSSIYTNQGTQFINTGWIGTGNVPSSGTSNSVLINVTQDSSIAWLWDTNFLLTLSANTNGTITSTNAGWKAFGSSVVVTATNNPGYVFAGWAGHTNGCDINGMTLTAPMTQERSLTAQFMGTPGMAVTPGSLIFTGQVYSSIVGQSLLVSNAGTTNLNYTITSDMFWLSVSNASGSLAAGQSTNHTVSVTTRGLDALRTYTGHLTFSDPSATNSPQQTTVNLTLMSVILPSKVVAWGDNTYGQTNVPAGLTNAIAVAGGGIHSLALKADGTVAAWGSNAQGQMNVPADLTSVAAVAAGEYHSLALKADGTVAAWGTNGNGQTSVPIGLTNVIAVAAGGFHSLALKSDGTVLAWGWNDFDQADVPANLSNVVAIAGGIFHSMALRADGSVTTWGANDEGQRDVPVGMTNAVAIACGGAHSLALKADGTIAAWGWNDFGQTDVPAELTNAVAVNATAGSVHSLALKADGTVAAWGDNDVGQTNVPAGLGHVVAIGEGDAHSLALVPVQSLVESFLGGPFTLDPITNWLIRGSQQSLSTYLTVSAVGTQHVNTGWIGTGSVPASGTSNRVTVTLTSDSSIIWTWTTNYWLQGGTNGSGTVAPTAGWFAAGSDVVVTAAPAAYWHFNTWTGDLPVQSQSSNPVTVTMSIPLSVIAKFVINTTSNQVPETWLASHGITNDFETASTNDTDGDGMQTWEEYIADLDPTSPTSSFVIATTSFTNGFVLRIPSSTGRVYSLDFGNSILSPNWQPVLGQTNITGNGGTLTLINTSPAAGGRYHRVRVALP